MIRQAIESAVVRSLQSEQEMKAPNPTTPIDGDKPTSPPNITIDEAVNKWCADCIIFFYALNTLNILIATDDGYFFIDPCASSGCSFFGCSPEEAIKYAMAAHQLYLAPSLSTVLNYYDL